MEASTGELFILLAKGDAWSEESRLLKLGLLSIQTSPPGLFLAPPFKQVLVLAAATIRISAGELNVEVWVDANSNALRVAVTNLLPISVSVDFVIWRNATRQMKPDDSSARGATCSGQPVSYPDQVVRAGVGEDVVVVIMPLNPKPCQP